MKRRAIVVAAVACWTLGCGRKGPPLPPLVKLPVAPADFTAERRGVRVDLQFVVPSANTDNTRPANVARVDVYAITSRENLPDDQIVKYGTRVGAVTVKAPRDPNATIEEDEPPGDMEPPEGAGLDQGASARLSEELSRAALAPIEPPRSSKQRDDAASEAHVGPLLPPRAQPLVRTYVAVGVSTRDRKGPFSKHLTVPLVPPPPPPGEACVTYDEKSIAVKWDPIVPPGGVQTAPADGELESKPIGVTPPQIAYNVYDTGSDPPAKLTKTPVAGPTFSDARIAWGEERCYTIRSVETAGGLSIESDAPSAACVTLEDHFPPAAPTNLQSSPGEGSINLIWDPNGEKDLAGYLVLRGDTPESLQPITPTPIQETTFRDEVQVGRPFIYAVQAVDKAGNVSAASKTVQEAAR